MNIRHSIIPSTGVWIATIQMDTVSPLSGREMDALSHLGEPLLQLGGAFSSQGLSFTLAESDIRIPSGLPYQIRWDLGDYPDAEVRAQVWTSAILSRIGSLMASLVTRDSSTPINQVVTVGRVAGVTEPDQQSVGQLASWMDI